MEILGWALCQCQVAFFIFCSSGPYASTFTSSVPLWDHGVKQDQDLKGPTANLANDSQISGLSGRGLLNAIEMSYSPVFFMYGPI